jgi:hypothetical protein
MFVVPYANNSWVILYLCKRAKLSAKLKLIANATIAVNIADVIMSFIMNKEGIVGPGNPAGITPITSTLNLVLEWH